MKPFFMVRGASPFLHLIAPESVRQEVLHLTSLVSYRYVDDMDDGGWISDLVGALRVRPGTTVALPEDLDPTYKPDFIAKRDRAALLSETVQLLASYQSRLAAQGTHGVLLCLQGIDGSGKDSTIRHVMSGVNPQGVQVSSFKVPSAEENTHDYLWRHARRVPARGEIGIFNRSHYEEVLVVRVHPELLDREQLPSHVEGDDVWQRRYREINEWERYLADNGIRVLKVLLNISKEKQRRRFLRRLELPDHAWKFSAADITGARVLGRLPGRLLRHALRDEHRLGSLVRDTRQPQVVRPRLRQCTARPHADRDRPPVPRRQPRRDARRASGSADPTGRNAGRRRPELSGPRSIRHSPSGRSPIRRRGRTRSMCSSCVLAAFGL